MALSTALQSIYNDNNQENPTVSPEDTSGVEMVGPQDQTPDVDSLDDNSEEQAHGCCCPKMALSVSLIDWIKDNVDTINQILDMQEEEGEDPNSMPDEYQEFEEFGIDDKQQDEQGGFDDHFGTDEQSSEDPMGGSEPQDMMGQEEGESEDPDMQGDIRYVPNAHLVYKRETSDGTFEELWFYNTDKDSPRSDEDIKNDILSGTDIDPKKLSSEDGTQQYTIWSVGNGQMIQIIGLSN